MSFLSTKNIALLSALVILLVGAISIITRTHKEIPTSIVVPTSLPKATSTSRVIGHSVENRDILAYIYGDGPTNIMFIGGIHGGYEWNSVILAYTFIEYLNNHTDIIPKNLTVTIVPSMNPDALYKVTHKEGKFSPSDVTHNEKLLSDARFNAHNVDLNRNFNCNWQSRSTWQSRSVSAGTSAFSEPESMAISNFILDTHPSAVVFWHSKSNAVYASQCNSGILPATKELMNVYAEASGYKSVPLFDAYKVTGAAEDWLASINIPAITVELKTHEAIDWEENLSGSIALLKYYGAK